MEKRPYINQSGQVRYFAKEHKRRKVPKYDPLWDSLVQGDVEKQLEEGIFEVNFWSFFSFSIFYQELVLITL